MSSAEDGLRLTLPRPTPGIQLFSIVGPTAVGKTVVATRVAPGFDAEIVSTDSMQVYRGMDIGTSKPTAAERKTVAYHVLDVADPTEPFSAARYKELADGSLVDITGRGKRPLLVGGSGLYYRAVVDDLDFSNTGDLLYNVEMHEELDEMEDQELYDLLKQLDPDAADEISHHNRRRILRAIEVARSGDRPISRRQHAWSDYHSPYELVATGMEMERELLYHRIDARVDEMIADGLVDEVRSLREHGLERGTTAAEALGYRQVLDGLEGLTTMQDAIAEMKKRTRHYAKRQLTWFGKDPRIHWFKVHASPHDPPHAVDEALAATAALVLEYFSSKLE